MAESFSSGGGLEKKDSKDGAVTQVEPAESFDDLTPQLREHNRFLQFFLGARKIKPIPKERQVTPEAKAWLLSRVTWHWLTPTLTVGYNRILELNDVYLQDPKKRIELMLADYHKKLNQYKLQDEPVKFKEFRAMGYSLRWTWLILFLLSCVFCAGELGMSLMSRNMLQRIEAVYTGGGSTGNAMAFAVGNTLVSLGFVWTMQVLQFSLRTYSETVRLLVVSAIYDKALKLSPKGRQKYNSGSITALITTDTNRLFMASRWSFFVLLFVPVFGAAVAILIIFIGVSALPGCALVILGIAGNILMSRVILRYRKKSLPYADKRIATVKETVENMRVIKFYGWESSFVELISKARHAEASALKRLGLVEGLSDASLTSIPTFAGVLSFGVRIAMGKTLTAVDAFPALTLFQMFIPFSMVFSQGLTSHADAWASVRRLDDFFQSPEDELYVQNADLQDVSISIKNGAFRWDEAEEAPSSAKKARKRLRDRFRRAKNIDVASISDAAILLDTERGEFEDEKVPLESEIALERAGARKFPGLSNINLEIRKGEIVMVVGPIGSGKSTLLNSILGMISKTAGDVLVDGTVSSVMSTWSQNDTIRNNILFGAPYDAELYAKVVHVCNLETDFALFGARDFSEIGERGITLSGGQKARIALARCMYNVGDIVLLDDVLSAVDGKVANYIFKHCVQEYLDGKTRIMATHNLKLLELADRVIYMPGDGTMLFDTLAELMQNDGFKLMYTSAMNLKEEEEEEEEANGKPVFQDEEGDCMRPIKRQASRHLGPKQNAALMEEEQRNRGTLSGKVLLEYMRSGSKLGVFYIVLLFVLAGATAAGSCMQTVIVNFWTSNKYNRSNGFYIGIYTLTICLRLASFASLAFGLCVFCFNSSSRFHNRAVENIYRAPMSYFDSTPLGRIINRFTDDTANLDTQLLMNLRFFLFSFSMMVASLVTVFVYVPYSAAVLVVIFIGAVVTLNYYRASARELKRMNSLFRSKMFSLVMETVSGLQTVVLYRRQEQFSKALNSRIDDMNVSFRMTMASQFWLALRVCGLTILVTLLTTSLCVYRVFPLNVSNVGLMLTLLPSVALSVGFVLPVFSEVENQLNSVERLHELGHSIAQEAPEFTENDPVADWPSAGRITFSGANLRYRENLPLVLHDFDLDVAGGEKVGIVGRTGAGKSTILASLFRLTELSGGNIVIDDVDISKIGLGALRQKLSIIPQEPVLFKGTIRFNLDPFDKHTDVELWDALRRSGVIRENEIVNQKVSKDHKFHLDTRIDSEGSNLSLGERQLLTLARALVRQSKILVLDEATATVDFETDKMIQQTISREFEHCTILCIAHRLLTIIHYDTIVIMDRGRIVEKGSPYELFKNDGSIFHGMCLESKITESDFLALQK